MLRIPRRALGLVVVPLAVAACGPRQTGGAMACGITALAGPSLLLDEFTRPGTVLPTVPEPMPAALPVRVAAGSAYRSVVGRTESGWVIGIEGEVPAASKLGFGVLVAGAAGPDGVVLYEGAPVPGAPTLGSVQVGSRQVPLLGLRADPARFGDAACPLFPDSLRG